MSNKKEVIFADGFILKRNENTPEWVIGNLSIKVEDAIAFLNKRSKNGWVNLDLKVSQEGKPYCQLDTWEPSKKSDTKKDNVSESSPKEELPF